MLTHRENYLSAAKFQHPEWIPPANISTTQAGQPQGRTDDDRGQLPALPENMDAVRKHREYWK